MVLNVHGRLTDRIRFRSEVEVSHALVAGAMSTGGDSTVVGGLAVQQALLDYRFTDPRGAAGEMGMRAGVMIVPMGIVNQSREPTTFHGVERPAVDTLIIPSTWSEGGVSFYHKPTGKIGYELLVMSGLEPRFNADDGLRRGRQGVSRATANGLAIAARGQFEPTEQVTLGVSSYYNKAGKNDELVIAVDGANELADVDVAVLGISADAHGQFEGIEGKAQFAMFTIGDADVINEHYFNTLERREIGDKIMGAYGELAYDVFHTLDLDEQLLPFARVEYYTTNPDEDERTVRDVVVGLTFLPSPNVVFKGDAIFRTKGGFQDSTRVNLGIGFAF